MTFEHYDMTTKDFVERLLSPERAAMLDPSVVLDSCPIAPDDKVADIGCGPGYFTLPLASALVNGTVYALDIDQGMVDACRERVEQAGLTNVETLTCSEFEFPIKKGSLMACFWRSSCNTAVPQTNCGCSRRPESCFSPEDGPP